MVTPVAVGSRRGSMALGELVVVPPPVVPATRGERGPAASPAAIRQPFGVWLFVLSAVGYGVLGMVLAVRFGYHNGDAVSRTANAAYVLFSRNPHLGAVGFVWNPLPSLAQLPILALKGLWPALQTTALAGVVMSACFMAGAVVQLRNLLRDHGTPRWWTVLVTATFAVYPLVLLYGADGLSEAPYLFFTLWATGRLTRWLHTDDVRDLVVAGVALGLDFMARYEVVGIAACAALLVFAVTFVRSDDPSRGRRAGLGLLDAVVLSVPFVLSFVGWALSGWVLTGSAFSQFSSVYGNSSQISVAAASHQTIFTSVAQVMVELLRLEPLFPLAIVVVLYLAIRRGDPDVLAALACFGGGLGFVAASYVAGSTISNLRYYILSVPLTMIAAGMIPASGGSRWASRAGDRAPAIIGNPTGWVDPPAPSTGWLTDILPADFRLTEWLQDGWIADWVPTGAVVKVARSYQAWRSRANATSHRRLRRLGLVALAGALFVPAMVTSWVSLTTPWVDPSDYGVRSVVLPDRYPPSQDNQILTLQYGTSISSYVDSLNLPNGSVLVDTWEGFAVVLTSDHMKQFVITSDRDFVQILNDPAAFGVRYLLDPSPTGVGVLDALNRRYPTLWRTGAGIGVLAMRFNTPTKSLPDWKLYAVKGSP